MILPSSYPPTLGQVGTNTQLNNCCCSKNVQTKLDFFDVTAILRLGWLKLKWTYGESAKSHLEINLTPFLGLFWPYSAISRCCKNGKMFLRFTHWCPRSFLELTHINWWFSSCMILTNSKVESPKQGLKSEFWTWSFL